MISYPLNFSHCFLQTGPKLQDSTVESKKGDHHVTYLFLQELHLLNILYLLRTHFQDDLQAVDLIFQKLLMRWGGICLWKKSVENNKSWERER